MKTKSQILDDVVDHIKRQGGMSVNNFGGCMYKGNKNRTCGHSFALKAEFRNLVAKENNNAGSNEVIQTYGDECHLKKYQGHPIDFWNQVQNLHDVKGNWDSKGNITSSGLVQLNKLKNKYNEKSN